MSRAKAVAKKEQEQRPVQYDPRLAGMGFEEADQESFAIPRLVILQALSPQLEDNEDLKPGLIYDTITGQAYKEVRVVPVHYQRRFIEWVPRDQGGGFVAEYVPGQEPQGERKGAAIILPNGHELHDTRQHFVLYESEDGWVPAVISMASTQIKKSKAWMTRMKMARAPMPAFVYRCTTVKESNDQGWWYGWVIEREGPTPAEVVELAIEFHDQIVSGAVKVQQDDVDIDEEIGF